MSLRSKLPLVALVAVTLPAMTSTAFAHIGGHAGGFTNGLAHPFYGLDHVLAMVAVGLWASQLGRPALWLLPLTFPLIMIVGALAGFSGVSVPFIEIGIAASVLALGAAVAFAFRPALVVSAAVIGFFALFHGYEHGASLPAHGMALTYGAGFVLATFVLHAIGLGAGLTLTALTSRPQVMRAAGGAIAATGLVLLVMR